MSNSFLEHTDILLSIAEVDTYAAVRLYRALPECYRGLKAAFRAYALSPKSVYRLLDQYQDLMTITEATIEGIPARTWRYYMLAYLGEFVNNKTLSANGTSEDSADAVYDRFGEFLLPYGMINFRNVCSPTYDEGLRFKDPRSCELALAIGSDLRLVKYAFFRDIYCEPYYTGSTIRAVLQDISGKFTNASH